MPPNFHSLPREVGDDRRDPARIVLRLAVVVLIVALIAAVVALSPMPDPLGITQIAGP